MNFKKVSIFLIIAFISTFVGILLEAKVKITQNDIDSLKPEDIVSIENKSDSYAARFIAHLKNGDEIHVKRVTHPDSRSYGMVTCTFYKFIRNKKGEVIDVADHELPENWFRAISFKYGLDGLINFAKNSLDKQEQQKHEKRLEVENPF